MPKFVFNKKYFNYGFFKNRCYNVITTIVGPKINKNLRFPVTASFITMIEFYNSVSRT
jgi:hypothetical protein